MSATTKRSLGLRVVFDDGVRFGPGKADLLQGIRDTGSISAAGRALNMSYRRAWTLIDALNVEFGTPLVHTLTGGQGGGGAQLTPAGEKVLATYRSMQAVCEAAATAHLRTLRRLRRNA